MRVSPYSSVLTFEEEILKGTQGQLATLVRTGLSGRIRRKIQALRISHHEELREL